METQRKEDIGVACLLEKHYESIFEFGIGETSRFEEMRRNFSAFAKYPQSVHLEMGQERGPRTDVMAASGC